MSSAIITFRPDEDIQDDMKLLREKTGMSFSEQTRRALKTWLDNDETLRRMKRSKRRPIGRSTHYLWQKLYEAVEGLSMMKGPIQDRLGSAALPLAVLCPEDFEQEEMRQTFIEFTDAMHQVDDASLGSFRASARAMTDEEAARWARKLFNMFNEVAVEMGATGRL